MPPGCWRPFNATSAYNTPLPDNAREWKQSAQIIARMLGDQAPRKRVGNIEVRADGKGGWPTYYGTSSDPVVYVHCVYSEAPTVGGAWGPCTIEGMAVHVPRGAIRQGECGDPNVNGDNDWYNPNGGWDRHMTVYDQVANKVFSFWHVKSCSLPAPGGRLNIGFGGWASTSGNGVNVETTTAWGTGSAAGGSNAVGTIRLEELMAGEIRHALAIKVDWEGFVWDSALNDVVYHAFPATRDGRNRPYSHAGAAGATGWNVAPMGSRIQLDIPIATINGYTWMNDEQKTILRALKVYGGIVNDTGAEGIFDLQLEGGLQYSALGRRDPWFPWAKTAAQNQPAGDQGWESYNGDLILHLYNPYTVHDDAWWMANIWSHLRVIDPCVSNNTCDSNDPGQLCKPGTQRCGECATTTSTITSSDWGTRSDRPSQHGCVFDCNAAGTAWVMARDCTEWQLSQPSRLWASYSACTSNEDGWAWCGH